MVPQFQNLSPEEYQLLKDSVALITILIAGADGKIDEDELEWAQKVTKIRSYASAESVREFYEEVGKDFSEKLSQTINNYPSVTAERTEAISEKLAELNHVFPKLDPMVAFEVYDSFVSFAEHVAKASGGFLRFFSVSSEEKKLIKLPMLVPISKPVEEEENGEQD